MELYYTGLTDTGNVRSNNEDFQFCSKIGIDEYLFIVADGMGGHSAGDVASRKAVTHIVKQISKGMGPNIQQNLQAIVHKANHALFKESKRRKTKSGMGTTLSLLYVKDDQGYVAHVGDSRIYRFNGKDSFTQLTEDHSFVGKLLKVGLITEEEARNHPRRNVIHQSLGLKPEITFQSEPPFQLEKGEKYLLCTDGLHGPVANDEIVSFLSEGATSFIAQQLIQRAKENGAPDNVTAVVVSTIKHPMESQVNASGLADTVELTAKRPGLVKRRRSIYILLLGLLILLVAALIYLLLTAATPQPQTF